MNKEIVLFVDEDAESTRQCIDVESGEVREEKISPGEICRKHGIAYLKMSEAIKALELYRRKTAGNGHEGAPVTMASLGPFVLARISNGTVVNNFNGQDIGKPQRLSVETIVGLARIFGGNGVKAKRLDA